MKGNAEQLEKRWQEWFETYHQTIHGYLFTLTRNAHLADDLAQETFIKAWEKRSSYEERGAAKAFLFQIATHCLKDFFRRKHETLCDEETWAVMERESGLPAPDDRLERSEEIQRLHLTMKRLSATQQQILTLRYFSQLKFSEIAEILEMPINTVLSHAHRGLAALRADLGADRETDFGKEG